MDLYLLGAGFSSDAGVPTMKNFIREVKKMQTAYLYTPFQAVLTRAIHQAEANNTENIEDLLATTVNDPVFSDLIWAFGLTINHCSRTFLTACQNGDDVGWYEDYAKVLALADAHVLTFNYDLILEEVLWWRANIRENYRLAFDEVHSRPCQGPKSQVVPVYKLHGSISWLWCLHCSYTINHYRHILATTYKKTPCPRCNTPLIPLIIPPTFHKAFDLALTLEKLWQQADLLFTQATRIIVGGLSFAERDEDFRNRFVAGVANNPQLKEVVIINRDQKRCDIIGHLLPQHIPWRAVKGFPQYCQEQGTH